MFVTERGVPDEKVGNCEGWRERERVIIEKGTSVAKGLRLVSCVYYCGGNEENGVVVGTQE